MRRCVRSRCCAPSTMARSSSTRSCPIITRAFRNPASAAGAAARSMSRRRAKCFRAMRRKSFPDLNSGTCATMRSPTFGAPRRRLTRSAAATGCRSRAEACARREQDFGGCRCQAFLIAGDARAADPVCHLSPHHALVEQLAAVREDDCLQLPKLLITPNCQRLRLQRRVRKVRDLLRRGCAPGPFSIGPRELSASTSGRDFDDSVCHGSAFYFACRHDRRRFVRRSGICPATARLCAAPHATPAARLHLRCRPGRR